MLKRAVLASSFVAIIFSLSAQAADTVYTQHLDRVFKERESAERQNEANREVGRAVATAANGAFQWFANLGMPKSTSYIASSDGLTQELLGLVANAIQGDRDLAKMVQSYVKEVRVFLNQDIELVSASVVDKALMISIPESYAESVTSEEITEVVLERMEETFPKRKPDTTIHWDATAMTTKL